MDPQLALTSPYHGESDEVIWNTFRNNNKEAFSVIYCRFFKVLLKRGLQISNDRELVKDCIHDLFVKMWENRMNLAAPASVKAYLIVSLQRKIIRQLRKYRFRETEMTRLPIEFIASKEDQLILEQHTQDQQYMVGRAINFLTRRQKEAVQLKFFANLSYEEIAEMMKISTGSTYNLVSKAIINMQKGLVKKTEPTLN
jgi:RNA polymerase sigma factor (sigma-70 family)